MSNENDNDNDNDISPILESAIAMHELFLTLIAAGFSESQALVLVGQVLRPTQS